MPSDIRIVSSNSAADIARQRALEDQQRALDELKRPLREFAANILRVMRGAGKAHEIPHQMTRLLELYDKHFASLRRYPHEQEIKDILDPGREFSTPLASEAEWEDGLDDMMRGALQMAASRLVGQGAQESAGEDQLFRGLVVIEAIREQNRKAATTARRAAKPTPAKKSKSRVQRKAKAPRT